MRAPLAERHQLPTGILNSVDDGLRALGTAAVDVGRRQMPPLSLTLNFSAASAKVKYRCGPVARGENSRWLLWVESRRCRSQHVVE